MIEYLDGKITAKTPTYIVIDINGLGYHVNISLHTYEKVNNLEKVRVFIQPVIKEDSHTLYGFFDEAERALFRHLISVSGVGPNTGRMMLSSLSPEELKRAIIRGDVSLIKSIKGIGPKGAQRIIVELQDVLKKTSSEDFVVNSGKPRVIDEALAAMTMLGFNRAIAEKAIAKALHDHPGDLPVEELIKQALKTI
ncbi:MAG: Holliday junction branch migration protein RuvA [Sphingobacteriales bacterium]|nr:MAG: Holliday junction branch migration protein RuvA [Sphingobacteriales bacterium]